jgi:hypothetical protein
MRAAIHAIFTDSVHRNYRWHIMKKANEKLGSFLGRHPSLAEEFNECVDESMSVDEFEACWAELVLKWDLAGNETFAWLKKYAHTWDHVTSEHVSSPSCSLLKEVRGSTLC